MESAALLGLVNQLDDNLGQLEDALGPILEESVHATSKKLPLLDRAKLNVTVVYAIESLLFSYFKVNGVDPKEHAIFKEIERVKQYFNKIKEAEETSIVAKPSVTLNKQAAARIIQHSLAGNGSSDLAQREREARERLMLKRKQRSENATPVQTPNPTPIDPVPTEVQIPPQSQTTDQDVNMQEGSSAEEGEIEEEEEEESSIQATEVPQPTVAIKEPHQKKRKQKQNSDNTSKLSANRKAEKKARKKAKKEAKMTVNGGGNTG